MKELAKYLNEAIDKNRERLFALSQQIWEYAEVGFQEYRSAEALKDFLKEARHRLFGRVRCPV